MLQIVNKNFTVIELKIFEFSKNDVFDILFMKKSNKGIYSVVTPSLANSSPQLLCSIS